MFRIKWAYDEAFYYERPPPEIEEKMFMLLKQRDVIGIDLFKTTYKFIEKTKNNMLMAKAAIDKYNFGEKNFSEYTITERKQIVNRVAFVIKFITKSIDEYMDYIKESTLMMDALVKLLKKCNTRCTDIVCYSIDVLNRAMYHNASYLAIHYISHNIYFVEHADNVLGDIKHQVEV